jgi:hypothetical protein
MIKYCNDFDIYMKKKFQYSKIIILNIEDRMIENNFRYLFNNYNYIYKYLLLMKEYCKAKHD